LGAGDHGIDLCARRKGNKSETRKTREDRSTAGLPNWLWETKKRITKIKNGLQNRKAAEQKCPNQEAKNTKKKKRGNMVLSHETQTKHVKNLRGGGPEKRIKKE